MALYRINQQNSIFAGRSGEQIIAEPGPLISAAIRAGILTRLPDPTAPAAVVHALVSDETPTSGFEETGGEKSGRSRKGKTNGEDTDN